MGKRLTLLLKIIATGVIILLSVIVALRGTLNYNSGLAICLIGITIANIAISVDISIIIKNLKGGNNGNM